MTAAVKGVVRVDVVSDTVWYVTALSVDNVHAALLLLLLKAFLERSEYIHSVRSAF